MALSSTRRAEVSVFKGKQYVGIREYYEKDGQQLPGKKGISLPADQFATLRCGGKRACLQVRSGIGGWGDVRALPPWHCQPQLQLQPRPAAASRSSLAHPPDWAPLCPTPWCRQRAGDLDAALHSKDTSLEVQLSNK